MLAAICIPAIPEAALASLQQFKSVHDPEYVNLVAPRVTLVFPNSALAEADFISHVSSCARQASATAVEFPSAQMFREESSGLEFVYLLPGTGYDWFVRLHDKLYSGPLAAQRRRDIPFIPHITLGRFTAPGGALALAARLASGREPIGGRVESVDVVHVGDDLVRHVHREPLGQ